MAGKTYLTKGYSTYTNKPSRRGAYDNESKMTERFRATSGYTDYVGSPSKIELLNKYVHSPTMLNSPNAAYNPNHGLNYKNSSPPTFHNDGSWTLKSSPNKYHPSSPVRGYHSDETHLVQSGLGSTTKHVRTRNITDPNRSWQSASPSVTDHPLTTSTNNVNEALGFLESLNHSPRSGPRQRGVLDELCTRAQPLEPQKRYARPAFVTIPQDIYRKRY